jgi:hypothetical protein
MITHFSKTNNVVAIAAVPDAVTTAIPSSAVVPRISLLDYLNGYK